MYQGGPEPLATLARALWPHTPGVRSDHSHWPQGTPARSPPYAKRADTGGCQSFVSPGLAGQDFQDSGPEIQPQVSLLPGSPSTILRHTEGEGWWA